MNREQWESLCDGCARCCLHKVERGDGGYDFTPVACRKLDAEQCRCTDYRRRVPGCLRLTPELVRTLTWLPDTCAYRLVAEGRELPDWHPLVSGCPESVHETGISVRGKTVAESAVHPRELSSMRITWVKC